MRIRTQLIAATSVSIALSIVMAIGILAYKQNQKSLSAVQERAQIASREAAGLIVLTQEFANGGGERTLQQWEARRLNIEKAIDHIPNPIAFDPTAPVEIRGMLPNLSKLFETLRSIFATAGSDMPQQRMQLVGDQLVTMAQATVDLAYGWADEANHAEERATNWFLTFLATITAGFVIVIATFAYIVVQNILRPLAYVQASIIAVQQNKLDVRTNLSSQNELGDFARGLDSMTASLQARNQEIASVTTTLINEVRLRSEAEQLARLIADNLPILIAYVDSETRYRFANRQYDVFFNIDSRIIIGKQKSEVVDQNRLGKIQPFILKALAGETVQFEYQHQSGASRRDIASTFIPDFREDGSVGGFFAMAEDITERKLREARLHSEIEKLRTTIESLPRAVLTTDMLGKITYLNPLAERLTDWRNLDAIGAPSARVFRLMNDQKAERSHPVEFTLAHKQIFESASEATLLRKNGDQSSIACSAAPIFNDQKIMVGVVVLFKEATIAV
jgi:PAS domain S-box-containing protein